MYHLRIHLGEYSYESIYSWLSQVCDLCIMVIETHDNRPHLHILFNETNVTKSTIIQQMLKKFPKLKGNGSYACNLTTAMKKKKVGDDEKAKAYVCKGSCRSYVDSETGETVGYPRVIGIAKIDVGYYHSKYWEVNEQVTASTHQVVANSDGICKKTKPLSWLEKVSKEIKQKYEVECREICMYYKLCKPTDYEMESYKSAHATLFCYYYKCYGKGVKKLNDAIIRDNWSGIIDSILADDEDAHQAKAMKVYKTLFPHL